MDKSKLLMYAKNTDASSSIRGFNYQTLKTLELWLQNHIDNNIDEVIYCEFMDDIFQKNILKSSVKFSQIKLYSSNFSFAAEEIQKTLLNFFMIDQTSDFLDFDRQFIFETNSAIAQSYRNNDADLLKEWHTNQDSIAPELLTRIAAKICDIVTTSIQDRIVEDQEALDALKSITEEYWERFAHKIKWNFLTISPEDEMCAISERIEGVIKKLPYPAVRENSECILGNLYTIVSLKMSETVVENKKLTYQLLADSLLRVGDDGDKWYAETLALWMVRSNETSSVGDILQITNASRYCRRRNYLSNDVKTWSGILKNIIDGQLVAGKYLKVVLYEYLLLQLLPDYETKIPTGDLIGQESYVIAFLGNLDWLTDPKPVENCFVIISYLHPLVSHGQINMTEDCFHDLLSHFQVTIDNIIKYEIDKNRLCSFLEIKSNFYFHFSCFLKLNIDIKESFEALDQLLTNIPCAPLYDVSLLGFRLNTYIKLMVKLDYNKFAGIIEKFEGISTAIGELISQRESSHNEAMVIMRRACDYMASNHKKAMLQSLKLFHQAKDKLHQAESRLNFIICLLCISKIYYGLRLHYAAKYYALAAYFASNNSTLQTEIKYQKIMDSLKEIFYNDFVAGSWLSAMHDFYLMIGFINNYETNINIISDEDLKNLSQNYIFISYSAKQIIPELTYLMQTKQRELENYYESNIEKNEVAYNLEFSNIDKIVANLDCELTDYPLLEIGTSRAISFKALGFIWVIKFENNFVMNLIAEDIGSLLQTMIAEIALSEVDLYLCSNRVEIELIWCDAIKEPEQIYDNNISKWKLFINEHTDIENTEKYHFKMVSQVIFILNELSLAPQDEFMVKIGQIQQNTNFLQKGFIINNYQYLMKQIIDEPHFESFSRNHFQNNAMIKDKIQLNAESEMLSFNSDVCDKYNRDQIMTDIEMRYINAGKALRYTLPKLKLIPSFVEDVHSLRKLGWKDWEILSAIANILANDKLHRFLLERGLDITQIPKSELNTLMKNFVTQEEAEVSNLDINFKMLTDALNIGVVNFLTTNHLSFKSKTPQWSAIKSFINSRMNVANDDMDCSVNPLYDI